jgi:hypothetical protein
MSQIVRLMTTLDPLPEVRYPDLPMCPCCEGEHLKLPYSLAADGMYHAICPVTGIEVPYVIQPIRMVEV